MTTDPLEIVASTADAALATDESGRVVIWNKAAERLLGYEVELALGKPCHELLCGRDVFGNRFCDEDCALHHMMRRHEAARSFEMDVRRESGEVMRVSVTVMAVPGPRPSQYTLIHVLRPVAGGRRVAGAGDTVAVSTLRSPASDPPAPRMRALTHREIEVLRVLADGLSTEDIADTLFISVTTVRNHIQNILRKLEVHSKVEAVSLALRHRVI
jgi:PAS domain S-box-containing protein